MQLWWNNFWRSLHSKTESEDCASEWPLIASSNSK